MKESNSNWLKYKEIYWLTYLNNSWRQSRGLNHIFRCSFSESLFCLSLYDGFILNWLSSWYKTGFRNLKPDILILPSPVEKKKFLFPRDLDMHFLESRRLWLEYFLILEPITVPKHTELWAPLRLIHIFKVLTPSTLECDCIWRYSL